VGCDKSRCGKSRHSMAGKPLPKRRVTVAPGGSMQNHRFREADIRNQDRQVADIEMADAELRSQMQRCRSINADP
jgi:hypothetical protein